jgi:hypothetical protein
MSLLADLEEFVTDHRPHGPLTGDATEPPVSRRKTRDSALEALVFFDCRGLNMLIEPVPTAA